MRAAAQPLILLAATLWVAPAGAELYKWVDERGVTNYSNAPPAAAAPANKLTRVENTISVYTPDESFMQAVKVARERSIQALAEPAAQRSAVGRIAVSSASGYEQCVSSGRLGCEDLYRTYFPAYLSGGDGLPAIRRATHAFSRAAPDTPPHERHACEPSILAALTAPLRIASGRGSSGRQLHGGRDIVLKCRHEPGTDHD